MTKGWDAVKENDLSDFTKLEAGKTVRIHIIGKEPDVRYQHWMDTKAKSCSGDGCSLCFNGSKRSPRFSIKVFNFENKRTETLEQGISVFNQINAIREALDGTLENVDLKIMRKGSTVNDTEYTVVNVPTIFRADMLIDKSSEDVEVFT